MVLRRTARLPAVLAVLLLAGCGAQRSGDDPDDAPSMVTVAAASSLTSAFQELGTTFEQANPRWKVQFTFAGSATLVAQLNNGAPADVFASADQTTMKKVVDAGTVDGTPQVFARNRLQIVVPAGNPKKIAGLADLNRPDLVISMCAPQVPIGRYAQQAYDKAGLPFPRTGSQELDVKQIVSRVRQGQADAGIVYATDVTAAGAKVAGVNIPDSANVTAEYPVAVLKEAPNSAGGQAFVSLLTSAEGRAVLGRFGFLAP